MYNYIASLVLPSPKNTTWKSSTLRKNTKSLQTTPQSTSNLMMFLIDHILPHQKLPLKFKLNHKKIFKKNDHEVKLLHFQSPKISYQNQITILTFQYKASPFPTHMHAHTYKPNLRRPSQLASSFEASLRSNILRTIWGHVWRQIQFRG